MNSDLLQAIGRPDENEVKIASEAAQGSRRPRAALWDAEVQGPAVALEVYDRAVLSDDSPSSRIASRC